MLSLLWANETSALLGNGSVLAAFVTRLLVLAALAKKMASNIHAKHPPMYFICLKWRTLHQMLRLFPVLTSFPFLGQHLGSGPHYLAFTIQITCSFSCGFLLNFFFLVHPHTILGGDLSLAAVCLKAVCRLQLLPQLHTLASPSRLTGSMPNYSRSLMVTRADLLAISQTCSGPSFLQFSYRRLYSFLSVSVCKIRIPTPTLMPRKKFKHIIEMSPNSNRTSV